ncbi:hypothetical protein J6590_103253 [Homalodisca vitripennis]|nr:hypothetical protein J6590_103253 [Homalodisca vitripennis]
MVTHMHRNCSKSKSTDWHLWFQYLSCQHTETSREAIDVCHRLKKRNDADRPAGIIAKFVRREDKLKFLEKRRVKRNLNSHDVGYTSSTANPVYVNESLSPTKRKLLAAARSVKQEKNYAYLWVRNGKVFLRKAQGDPFIIVSSMEQIEKL